jgi:RimJ/RimL family protein N-acetyltransferase
MIDPPETLPAGLVVLRRPRVADAESIFQEYGRDPEVVRFLSWRPHRDAGETREFLEKCEHHWTTGTEWTWCMTNVDGVERVVGMVACRREGHAANLGYVLARRLWNRGIVTGAVRAVIDWLEQDASIRRIWAVCDTSNEPSARVMEKVGMRREGVLKQWLVHPNVSPDPRDVFVYAKVR